MIAAALASRRRRRAQHLLRRGARHRHAAGRSDRGRRPHAGLSPRTRRTRGFCRIGSVKSNVGHLVIAAGAAGLIKTALALHARATAARSSTPSAQPEDRLRRARRSASYDRLRAWPRGDRAAPRRRQLLRRRRHQRARGLEEAPLRVHRPTPRRRRSCCCSRRARRAALAAAAPRLRRPPRRAPPTPTWPTSPTRCASAASAFAHRACVVAEHADDAVAALAHGRLALRAPAAGRRARAAAGLPVPGPGRAVRRHGPRAVCRRAGVPRRLRRMPARLRRRAAASTCASAMFAGRRRGARAPPSVTQPAIFALEYALARLLDGAAAYGRPR